MLKEEVAARVEEDETPYVAPPAPPAPEPEIRLGDTLSPVDLPASPVPLPHGLKWAATAIAWATLVLFLLNAHALRDWAYRLPPSDASARIVTLAEGWYDTIDRVGFNRPVEAMHGWWQAVKDARFREGDGGRQSDGNTGQAAPEAS